MPYIKHEIRKKLDPLIESLANRIGAEPDDFTGILNYVITTLVLKIIQNRYTNIKYWMIASITGVFKNVSDEFYRRVVIPYEDKKIQENGDITEFTNFT